MELTAGMPVRCHRNLRRGDWSIAMKGKVVAHVPELVPADVTFSVRERARQQVVARRCRQVHAWAIGRIGADPPAGPRTPISYNPYCGLDYDAR